MRVVVTGAAGFVGAAVAARLVDRGHDVLGVDARAGPGHGGAPPLHRVDVRDSAGLYRLLRGADVVCHQAAMVGNDVDVRDLPRYAEHNDVGTATLLAGMHDAGVGRLVLASSMVVYGEGSYTCGTHGPVVPGRRRRADLDAGRFDPGCPGCGRPAQWRAVGEDAPMRPRSGYAASKVAQEHLTGAWAEQVSGRAVALRYHNVYGPWMPRDTPYAGVAAVFRSALERGDAPEVFEDGRQMRDFVHVDDVARANALAVEAVGAVPAGSVRAYNVCSGRPIAIGEVAGLLAGARGGPPPRVTGRYRVVDVRHVVGAGERALAELGLGGQVPPGTGIPALARAPLRAASVGPGGPTAPG
jgi:dTDP-L-rhamnose 4-epimerase